MKPGMRRWSGRWQGQALGGRLWRFEPDPPTGLEVLALEVHARAPLPRSAEPELRLTWVDGGVEVLRQGDGDAERFAAREVLIHEPLPLLYEQLPLARLDRRARRFWARVFFLARMPGGRRFLRWLARRR